MKHTKCHSQVSELTKCLQRNQSHKCICYYGIVEHHSTPPKDLLQNGVVENIECVLCVCAGYTSFSMFVPISYCWCAEACWFWLVYGRFHQPLPHLSAHTEPGLGWAALLESCRDSHTSLFIHLKTDRALTVLPFYLIPSLSLALSLHRSGLFLRHCHDVVGVTPAL